MSDKIILTDCDGVCLDWEVVFHEWALAKGLTRLNPGGYDMSAQYEITETWAKKLVREFNNSTRIADMPPLRDSKEGIAALVAAGYKFIAITSLGLDPLSHDMRSKNLEDLYGDAFVEVICLDTGGDKDDALEPYRDSGMIWIEDKWENAVLGAEMGLRTILVDHPHNAEYNDERIVRASTWVEIVEEILS